MKMLIPVLVFILQSCTWIDLKQDFILNINPDKNYKVLNSHEVIFIESDSDLDRSSLEKCISIEQEIKKLDLSFEWDSNRKVLINIHDDLIPGLQYRLKVQGIVKSKGGREQALNLSRPFYFDSSRFTPFLIESMEPEEGSKLSMGSEIRFHFNHNLNELSLSEGIQITPDSPIKMEVDENILSISPEESWVNLKNLTIQFNHKIKDLNAQGLYQNYDYHYFVEDGIEAPEIESTGPCLIDWENHFPWYSLDLNSSQNKHGIRVRFTQDMNIESVKDAFSITPTLPGSLHTPNLRDLIFIPSEGLTMGTNYALEIDTRAKNFGDISIQHPFLINFTPHIQELELISLECTSGEGFLLNEYSDDSALQLPVLEPSPYALTFRFTFSRPFPTETEKRRVQENIRLSEIFSNTASASAALYCWENDYCLTILYSGFKYETGKSHYYIMELKSGANGIRTDDGAFLPDEIQQLFKVDGL